MAKIIREGLQMGWWVGRIVECGGCLTQFEVETGDPAWEKDKTEPITGVITESVAFVECPNCQRAVAVTPPVLTV